MLTGTASVEALAAGAATIPAWPDAPLELDDVVVVQAMFELPMATRQELLPPALHPTNPPTMVVQAWRCGSSPWGPFSLVQLRVQCRSGLRPRGLVVAAACDNEDAAAGLAASWGFACETDRAITVARYYDESVVEVAGTLRMRCADPEPLELGDVAYSSTLTLAHTPNGLRLVQVDAEPQLQRAERTRARVDQLDAAAWRAPLLEPRYPVSSSVAVGRIVVPPVRYCCRPDALAFDGTESVGSTTPAT